MTGTRYGEVGIIGVLLWVELKSGGTIAVFITIGVCNSTRPSVSVVVGVAGRNIGVRGGIRIEAEWGWSIVVG